MLTTILAGSAFLLTPQACVPSVRPSVAPVMQMAPLVEACAMEGGRVTGTVVRQSNGLVVPTFGAPSVGIMETAAKKVDGELREEACAMNGGRVTGTVMRQSNGLFVTPAKSAAALAAATPKAVGEPLQEACAMDGGRVTGTVIRQSNGLWL